LTGRLLAWLWRRRNWVLLATLLLMVTSFWLLYPFWRLTSQFGQQTVLQPSRLYARSERIEPDAPWTAKRMTSHLDLVGYRAADASRDLLPGEYRFDEGSTRTLLVRQRRFPGPDGMVGGGTLRVTFSSQSIRRIDGLTGGADGQPQWVEAGWALLEPALITSYYSDNNRERRPVVLDQVPQHLVDAIVAAEDQKFYDHQGISITGIARAFVVNLRGGQVQQGGSTLTQQLVKNLYLTQDRTFVRKLREAVLATMLEIRYSKNQILQAYLNEIFLGRIGRVNLMGVGAAAHGYFGKPIDQITLGEAATIAGVIPAPNRLTPVRHPEAALEARNKVLGLMLDQKLISEEAHRRAVGLPLVTAPKGLEVDRARYAVDAIAAEVEERFGIQSLAGRGLQILSTLSLEEQIAAEEAVSWGVEALEGGWQKNHKGEHVLQASLLSVVPATGEVLAYVGGRDYGQSQFDRVRLAHRQAGSAFKPLVYAAAFAQRVATPIDQLDDSPLEVVQAGRVWKPKNYDGDFRGLVTVRESLERSLNVPTAELALEVGLPKVVSWARELGIESPLQPVPSIALGAFEVTPTELLTAYATLANGGRRPQIHLITGILDANGKVLDGRGIPQPRQVIGADVAYVTTSLLEGVFERGTARGARAAGLEDPMAGKTGTTNGGRDSWFVGYAPQKATAVWVGYDEGDTTSLTGARGALPVWTRYTARTRPPGGYSRFLPPAGVVTMRVDPSTGQRATGRCPYTITEVFLEDDAPEYACEMHGGDERWGRKRGFWSRVFGEKKKDSRDDTRRPD
jgi:penicillin-binding protein 1B